MAKHTALVLQMSTDTGDDHTQMMLFANSMLYRRTVSGATRTQWRSGFMAELPRWLADYVKLGVQSSPDQSKISHGLALIEITEDEATECADKNMPRSVRMRYQRVIDAMDDGSDPWPVTESEFAVVQQYVIDWMDATSTGNDAWLDEHTHPRGTAKEPAPTPAPAPVAAAPEPAPGVDRSNPHGWPYAALVGGYVERPNGERYRSRDLHGESDIFRMREARLHRDHIFLWGDPGTGKTALVEAAFGTDLVTMLGTEDTEWSDFIGSWVSLGKGKYVWQDGALLRAMEGDGTRGYALFVDEAGVIFPKTMTGLYSVMDGRDEILVTANPKRGIVKALPGFCVVLASNPHAPGVRISEALTSRIGLSIEVTTDMAMMKELGVPEKYIAVANNLLTRRAGGEPVWVPQARELLRAARQEGVYGPEIARRNLIAAAPEDDREVLVEVMKREFGASADKWLTL